MVIAALTYFLGYILMYLAFKGSMGSNVSFGLIALFYFIAGTGGSAS